jgi:hypothetical protein
MTGKKKKKAQMPYVYLLIAAQTAYNTSFFEMKMRLLENF